MEPEQAHAEVAEEHRIETIGDLVAVATRDNLTNLLADLRSHLIVAIHPELGPLLTNPHVFVWLDDGRNDIILTGPVQQ